MAAALCFTSLLCASYVPAAPRGAPMRAASRAAAPVMMPIGVPKVAYRVPGSAYADWVSNLCCHIVLLASRPPPLSSHSPSSPAKFPSTSPLPLSLYLTARILPPAAQVDLYNRLYRERILFLGQEINDEIANQIIGVMLYLDSEDNTKPISLYINSPGGSVTSGFAMFDTMRHIKSEVSTINVGLAASMGSFLLMGGTKGKRLALPHSRTMIHQPSGGAQGQASDIKVEAEQILSIRERVVNYYSQLSGQPREKVRMDIDRDNFMSAEETLKYGLIDRVIQRT